jgi:hypothetical protein
MGSWLLPPPPRCPVCDAEHTTCTSPGYRGQIRVTQMPARDGVGLEVRPPVAAAGPRVIETPRQLRQRRKQQQPQRGKP